MIKVGDIVKYEVKPDGKRTPRWDFGDDKGESGKFLQARVVEVDTNDNVFKVKLPNVEADDTDRYYCFPICEEGKSKPGFPVVDKEHTSNVNALHNWFNNM